MASTEPLIRISISCHRKPGLSEKEFHRYWAHEHGLLAAEWVKRSGIVRYVQVRAPLLRLSRVSRWSKVTCQYHTSSEHRNLAKKMSDAVGRPVLDWDGQADFYVRKYEDFEAAFLDKEYLERIRPDEEKLINMDSIRLTVGVEYVCVDNGAIVDKHHRSF